MSVVRCPELAPISIQWARQSSNRSGIYMGTRKFSVFHPARYSGLENMVGSLTLKATVIIII